VYTVKTQVKTHDGIMIVSQFPDWANLVVLGLPFCGVAVVQFTTLAKFRYFPQVHTVKIH
jgi:hypothetical protein